MSRGVPAGVGVTSSTICVLFLERKRMPRETWECTDPRDATFDRVFHVYRFDEASDVKGAHWSIDYVLAGEGMNLDDALVIVRCVTRDVFRLTRTLVVPFTGKAIVLPDAFG